MNSKLLSIFNRREKRNLCAILLCMVLVGLIEMLSVATILPFLTVLAKPEIISHYPYLPHYFIHALDHHLLILFLGAMVFCVLVLGNAFSAFSSWLMIRFVYHQGKRISCALLEKYLHQPYVFFLTRHSSTLIRNLLQEVDRFIQGILMNGLQSLAKLVVVACILGLLFLIDFSLAATVVFSLSTLYFIIYKKIRKRLSEVGKVASMTNSIRVQVITEALGAIKELKILNKEQKFIDTFAEQATHYANAEALNQLSPSVIKSIVEAIAFGGMILIALYLASKGDVGHAIPLLGLYALAGYRLLPAIHQIFLGFTQLRYHLSALDILSNEMHLSFQPTSRIVPLSFQSSLTLEHIYYAYHQQSNILKNIHCQIKKNTTVGIVGRSGAGKTTLMDIILGLLEPSLGKVMVDGITIDQSNRRGWQANIGYVPQTIFLIDDTVAHNIALGLKTQDIDWLAVEKAAKLANLHDFICNELPQGYQTLVGERGIRLSGGQRQRIGIARALYHDPQLLIFDEATSALDSLTEKAILEAIPYFSHQKTIVLVAHRLNTVKTCDVIYVLNEGAIVAQGTYQQLLQSDPIFQQLAHSQSSV